MSSWNGATTSSDGGCRRRRSDVSSTHCSTSSTTWSDRWSRAVSSGFVASLRSTTSRRGSSTNRRRAPTGFVTAAPRCISRTGSVPTPLKSVVHPARSPVWTMRWSDGSLVVDPALVPQRSTAVIGAKACDLRALAVLERTQTGGPHADPGFVARRAGLVPRRRRLHTPGCHLLLRNPRRRSRRRGGLRSGAHRARRARFRHRRVRGARRNAVRSCADRSPRPVGGVAGAARSRRSRTPSCRSCTAARVAGHRCRRRR